MRTNIHSIKTKLHQFRQKYYLNQIMRGGVLLTLLFSSLFILFSLSEGLFWLSVGMRTALFTAMALATAGITGYYIVYPLSKYFNLTQTLTDEEASKLIGKHFADVDDRLLNLLQLSNNTDESNQLLLAAIESKTLQLNPIPFAAAVNFNPNKKLARYIGIPALILLLVLLIDPETFTHGANRFVNFRQHFTPPPPFNINVPNYKAQLIDGESHTIDIQLSGKQLPAELFVFIKSTNDGGFQKYLLTKKNNQKYSYTFKNVHQAFDYYVGNDLHGSQPLSVSVMQRPSIAGFNIILYYPAYTKHAPDTLEPNVGDFAALKGTTARWNFTFKGPVTSAQFKGRANQNIQLKDNGSAYFTKQILDNENYVINLGTQQSIYNTDTVRYAINVVDDKFPSAIITEPRYEARIPATGILDIAADLSDDFGFTKAELHWRYIKSDNPAKIKEQFNTQPFNLESGSNITIANKFDFYQLGIEQGDEIEYFIKAWDNDIISGPKASVSTTQKLMYQSLETLYNQVEKDADKFDKDVEDLAKDSKELNQKLEDIESKLLDNKNLSYDDKKELQKMLESRQQMMNKMEDVKKNLQDQIKMSEENNLYTEETLKKLEELEKMMEEMSKDPELQKMLEEMQKNMEKPNKSQMKQQLDKMKDDAEKFQRDLERMLELFRQMQIDQKVQETIQKLDNMEKKQDLLKDNLNDAKTKDEQNKIGEKQDELAKQMDDIKKDLKDLENLKKESEHPDKEIMDDLKQDADKTQQDMQDSQQEMNKNNKKQAQSKQQNAKQRMQQMKEKLNKMQQDMEMNQQAENYEDLRALLENLLKLSFEQEDLRNDMKKLKYTDPKMPQYFQRQDKLADDMEMLEDSLVELSKRAFEIQKFVLDEVDQVNKSMENTRDYLTNKQIPNATSEQSRTMTHVNNLANMLTESLDKMQQSMKQQKQGKGKMCKNPNSMGGMPMLQKMQGMLNKQMQQMMQQMKDGKGMDDKEAMEKLGEMAGKQEGIRQKLKEYFDKLKKDGEKGMGDGGKILQDMKETEKELLNKKLTAETLIRQQQILSRMLDYDKAMREREYENKRESKTGIDRPKTNDSQVNPDELKEKIRKEGFNKNKYRYTPTYQNLIDQYYKLLETK